MKTTCLMLLVLLTATAAMAETALDPIYLIRLTNSHQLLVTDLKINPETERVSCLSYISGLRSAFPLERLYQVLAVEQEAGPSLGTVLYTNTASILNVPDDGGTPAGFVVNSSGGGRSSSSSRKARSSGSSSSGRSSSSRSSSGSRSTGSQSSSSSGGTNPLAKIFGGK